MVGKKTWIEGMAAQAALPYQPVRRFGETVAIQARGQSLDAGGMYREITRGRCAGIQGQIHQQALEAVNPVGDLLVGQSVGEIPGRPASIA